MNQPSLKSPKCPLQPLTVITKVWFSVGMDLIGPLVESNGFRNILTVINDFTRWIFVLKEVLCHPPHGLHCSC